MTPMPLDRRDRPEPPAFGVSEMGSSNPAQKGYGCPVSALSTSKQGELFVGSKKIFDAIRVLIGLSISETSVMILIDPKGLNHFLSQIIFFLQTEIALFLSLYRRPVHYKHALANKIHLYKNSMKTSNPEESIPPVVTYTLIPRRW